MTPQQRDKGKYSHQRERVVLNEMMFRNCRYCAPAARPFGTVPSSCLAQNVCGLHFRDYGFELVSSLLILRWLFATSSASSRTHALSPVQAAADASFIVIAGTDTVTQASTALLRYII
ncbi:hypothetical protein JB92DRAFT_1145556 [Gautieria morchelliformis]|nr:hypothetical protein JB92DRAFT_1145556 [Gautieria morchelliformis]